VAPDLAHSIAARRDHVEMRTDFGRMAKARHITAGTCTTHGCCGLMHASATVHGRIASPERSEEHVMNQPMQTCAIAAFVAAISGIAIPARADTDAGVQGELVKLTQELMDALIPGKADVWQRILADDAVIIDEFGHIQDKAEAVKSVHPFPQGLSGSIEIRDPKVRVDGDSAVLQGELYEQETVFGQKLLVRYIFCNTFVRRASEWKLAAATDVTLPTPPPTLSVDGLVVADYAGTYSYGPNRAFSVAVEDGKLFYTTKAGGPHTALDPVAKDVFMDGGDEKNLIVFRRDVSGRVVELIERRKFNDLHMQRDDAPKKT